MSVNKKRLNAQIKRLGLSRFSVSSRGRKELTLKEKSEVIKKTKAFRKALAMRKKK